MGMSVGTAGQSQVKSEPNVVPMIDVMLVLLIIFMIVTPLISAGFKATMPKGANLDPDPEGENEVILGIDESGNYYIDGRGVAKGALEDQLRAKYTNREKDKILYLKADNQLAVRVGAGGHRDRADRGSAGHRRRDRPATAGSSPPRTRRRRRRASSMGMSVGGGSSTLTSEPNVVPMIDILLVLLIIFMITQPLSRTTISVQVAPPIEDTQVEVGEQHPDRAGTG